jgi:trehalose synthase
VLGSVPTTPKTLESYRPIIGDQRTEEILQLAGRLKGARVLNVNATAFGGGVAEILGTLIPLMNDIGLQADWQVIKGADEFFNVTKAMHNSLQGMYYDWTPEMRDIWLNYNRINAELFDESYDFVVIHDPQPAAIPTFLHERNGKRDGKWVWRCHIDLTDAQVQVWDFLRPHVETYDGAIFTLPAFVKDDLMGPEVFTIPPAIDPLSPKNVELPADMVDGILQRYSVDPARPMITQISRFDPWKDPLGVIDVYRQAKREVPELQLVLVASMASDDPEGWDWYERTVRRAGEDFDIHILSNLNGVGNIEVNAFQRAARVVIQKSIREGFGLVVSEALWKGRPVVAGNVGGIPLQIINGETGYLVNTTEECVERVASLLTHPEEAAQMGLSGTEFVRDRFLTTRYLRDYLSIFSRLSGAPAEPQPAPPRTQNVRP